MCTFWEQLPALCVFYLIKLLLQSVCNERCILLCTVNVVYPWVLADGQKPIIGNIGNRQRLGPAGLALHYANIVLQIDTLVSQSILYLFHSMTVLFFSLP